MVEVDDVGCPVWRFHAEQCVWRVCHVLDLLHAQPAGYLLWVARLKLPPNMYAYNRNL